MRRLAAALALVAFEVLLAPSGAAAGEAPEILYMLHCQGCHLPDGSGSPGAVPALAGSLARYLAVPGGRAYLVQVPGSASSRLDDGELAAVLNWMVHRFGPPAAARAAAPYTRAEVAALRATPLVEVEGVRRRLRARLGLPEWAADGPGIGKTP